VRAPPKFISIARLTAMTRASFRACSFAALPLITSQMPGLRGRSA
jgi:hypothetical protein